MRVEIGTADIGELDVLQVLPDAFVGIQVGSVTRPALQPDPALGMFQDGFDRAAAMNRRTVPDHQQSLVDGVLQVFEEPCCEDTVDRRFECLKALRPSRVMPLMTER